MNAPGFPMPALLVWHFAVTCVLCGLIWTIQLLHYPLLADVGAESFSAYHLAHTRNITPLVGPLMLFELASGAWLWLDGQRSPAFLLSLGLLALVWISTALLQVPLHHQLAGGFDPAVHARLVHSNWIRTLAWSGRLLCLVPAFLARP